MAGGPGSGKAREFADLALSYPAAERGGGWHGHFHDEGLVKRSSSMKGNCKLRDSARLTGPVNRRVACCVSRRAVFEFAQYRGRLVRRGQRGVAGSPLGGGRFASQRRRTGSVLTATRSQGLHGGYIAAAGLSDLHCQRSRQSCRLDGTT